MTRQETKIFKALNKLNKRFKYESLEEIESITNNTPDRDYNCWGWTVYVTRLKNYLTWVDNHTMEHFIKFHTIHTEKPKIGDFAVYRNNGYLTHTAPVIGKHRGQYITLHKPGARALDIDTVENVCNDIEEYGEVVEYRRVVVK